MLCLLLKNVKLLAEKFDNDEVTLLPSVVIDWQNLFS